MNHRIPEWLRLAGITVGALVPPPCPSRTMPEHRVQDFVQMVPEYPQCGRLCTSSGLCFSLWSLHSEEILLRVQVELSEHQFSLFFLFNCSASLGRAWSILWHIPAETCGFCFPSSFPKLLTILSVLFHLLNHSWGTTLIFFSTKGQSC